MFLFLFWKQNLPILKYILKQQKKLPENFVYIDVLYVNFVYIDILYADNSTISIILPLK
jgi:hypothetical protein